MIPINDYISINEKKKIYKVRIYCHRNNYRILKDEVFEFFHNGIQISQNWDSTTVVTVNNLDQNYILNKNILIYQDSNQEN